MSTGSGNAFVGFGVPCAGCVLGGDKPHTHPITAVREIQSCGGGHCPAYDDVVTDEKCLLAPRRGRGTYPPLLYRRLTTEEVERADAGLPPPEWCPLRDGPILLRLVAH